MAHTDGRTEKDCKQQQAARCRLFWLDLELLLDLEKQMVIVPGSDLQAVCHRHCVLEAFGAVCEIVSSI